MITTCDKCGITSQWKDLEAVEEEFVCDQCLEVLRSKEMDLELNGVTAEISQAIRELAGGTIFSLKFIKRSNGELREMVCRLGVKKHLATNGRERAYDPAEKGLLCVYDLQKKGYRSIPLENILEIRIKGKVYSSKPVAV